MQVKGGQAIYEFSLYRVLGIFSLCCPVDSRCNLVAFVAFSSETGCDS